ncbi:lachesin isoform X2 [Bemisia tabaci]|uniref:lachesin isoform X2 n=1 Tax=Bemisia tabaci TaxID=7038 RepID=UPI0008F9984A|nr:PREDICTED: lachesin-like [Bemisia tabaci]
MQLLMLIALILLILPLLTEIGEALSPEFVAPLKNQTVTIGRDATFECHIRNLGGYRIGWVYVNTREIQAIHDHVITPNPRVSVSQQNNKTWSLHIKEVEERDRGLYMCQINTDPMQDQMAYLNVVVPPDIVDDGTSSDQNVNEGGNVWLTCKAKGFPKPTITWKREHGDEISIKDSSDMKIHKYKSYPGETLNLTKISRSEMGAYFCIAANGVQPTVSKRIIVNVHFPPQIQVPNQLVGAPEGTDVTLECYVEAHPKSINYWLRENSNVPVVPSEKYKVELIQLKNQSQFEFKLTLCIRNFQKEDVGSYQCVAKNSMGEMESNIRIYQISGPTIRSNTVSLEDGLDSPDVGSEKDVESNNIWDYGPVQTDDKTRNNRVRKPEDQRGDENLSSAYCSSPLALLSLTLLARFLL